MSTGLLAFFVGLGVLAVLVVLAFSLAVCAGDRDQIVTHEKSSR